MKNRISCFAVAALLLALTLWFTACGSTSAEAGASSQPCYHVTVYSPRIVNGGMRGKKYTVTVDSFSELLPDPKLSAEREYQLLQIPLGDGRFELVPTSLVEIEYY